ncbi:SDR family oxidoreductase [Pseudothioclava nitratireducens]|uniref:SDR family oxidoreductase n=1 Tax=Pseudothioclava nitratireducens TaxID=1928646 RepID=UPI0023DAD2C3|nr:SDR family oxidoreductase [Defluviimonas nitratireducens]MDF1620827.1 SDR family oxidoreductase [Defluviimonas nitratireducens]
MKAALVTGGAQRLGRAMALYLAGRGVDVAIHYNGSAEAAEATAAEARAKGVRAVTLQADMLDEAQVTPLIATAAEGLGRPLDILINNASIFEYDRLDTVTRESWDRHFESNLRAPVVLSQHFARQAPKADRSEGEPRAQALIVNMLDQRMRKLTPEFMSYTLAKMGLWAFTQTAAQALAPDIRVNAIGPGPTLQGARQSESHFSRQRAATILERGSNPEDICAALGYFLDAPAVTGQLLCVDGGQHLAWQTPDVLGVE